MEQAQIKNIIKNVGAVAVVIAILGGAYWFFFLRVNTSSLSGLTMEQEATQTVILGEAVLNSLKELESLKSSVASSATLFSAPAFKQLQDYTVEVSSEPVGRDNPFLITDWKLRAKAAEAAAAKQGGGQTGSTAGY